MVEAQDRAAADTADTHVDGRVTVGRTRLDAGGSTNFRVHAEEQSCNRVCCPFVKKNQQTSQAHKLGQRRL